MSDLWQTIEEAAVTLGLSVRTVNRHITAGKLQSRLFEGRREVLISQEDLRTKTSFEATSSSADKTNGSAQPSQVKVESATSTHQPADDNATQGNRTSGGVYAEPSTDIRAMLALADSVDDKATLAVSAYQTLARSAEIQVQSLRRAAFGAWAAVGVIAVGAIVAVGWGTYRLTSAELSSANAQSKMQEQTEQVKQLREDRDEARRELAKTHNELANIAGQVKVWNDQNEKAKADSVLAQYIIEANRKDRQPAGTPDGGRVMQASNVIPGSTSRPTTHPAGKPIPPLGKTTYITNSAEAFDPK